MSESRWTRRDFLRRSAAATGVAVGAPALIGSCARTGTGGNTLQTARQQGYITIGIADEEPYGFKDKQGNVTGEAPEVARAVMQNLDVPELRAELTEFGSLIPGLNAGHFDLVAAGMYITPKRCKQADFSVPDYQAPTALLVPKGNPKGLVNFQDIAESDASVAVWGGAQEEKYAKANGVPASRIQTFGGQLGLFQAVVDERVYCGALTNISLNSMVEDNPNAPVEVTEGFNPVVDGEEVLQVGGFTFRQAQDQFRKKFSRELNKLQESRRWVEIVKPFGFTEDNLPPEGVTTDELCQSGSPSPTGS